MSCRKGNSDTRKNMKKLISEYKRKNLDDDDSIEEGIVAIVSYVTSLTLSTLYILESCIEIKMNLNF